MGHGKKGNVMTPLNWFAGIVEPCLFGSSMIMTAVNPNSWLDSGLFVVGVALLVFYGFMYAYFAFTDPDRLQTEEYNLMHQELAAVQADQRIHLPKSPQATVQISSAPTGTQNKSP